MRVWFQVKKCLMLLPSIVAVVILFGMSGSLSPASARPAQLAVVPAVPTGLAARAGNAQVSLAWAPSTGATSYHVKRALTTSGPFVLINEPTTTSFIDTGLANGRTYFYAVAAANSAGKRGNP